MRPPGLSFHQRSHPAGGMMVSESGLRAAWGRAAPTGNDSRERGLPQNAICGEWFPLYALPGRRTSLRPSRRVPELTHPWTPADKHPPDPFEVTGCVCRRWWPCCCSANC